MIYCITYGDKKFEKSKFFNIKTAKEKGKADKVIAYGPEDIDNEFYKNHEDILSMPRGNGYWLWKPYLIMKTLEEINDGDFLCYSDAGLSYKKPVRKLVRVMEENNVCVMPFAADLIERQYSKRDALILTDTDFLECVDSPQAWSGIMLFKNCEEARNIVKQWLDFCCDRRIVTDDENVLGFENYDGFIENRHDQSAWSLTCKKNSVMFFRCPFYSKRFKTDFNDRSNYGKIMYKHHMSNISSYADIRKIEINNFKKRVKKKLHIN